VPATLPSVRFAVVDVYVDSGNQPLAAYQCGLTAARGDVKIVGVEGGEHAAFAEPPYYDPAAMMNDRTAVFVFGERVDRVGRIGGARWEGWEGATCSRGRII